MASSDTSTTLSSGNLLGIINCLMQLRKVCNHPDLFAGRPIVSAFDMLPLRRARRAEPLARLAAERERGDFATSTRRRLAPKGLHLLSLEQTSDAFDGAFAFGGGERWSALRARHTAVARDVVLEALATSREEEDVSSFVLGRATPDASRRRLCSWRRARASAAPSARAVAERLAASTRRRRRARADIRRGLPARGDDRFHGARLPRGGGEERRRRVRLRARALGAVRARRAPRAEAADAIGAFAFARPRRARRRPR